MAKMGRQAHLAFISLNGGGRSLRGDAVFGPDVELD
jgi:hypothetical protein